MSLLYELGQQLARENRFENWGVKYTVPGTPGDVLNMALFGQCAKTWRDANPDKKGKIRDYANVSQLVCLSNLENLNALFISEGMLQPERLLKLNRIAIQQMKLLTDDTRNSEQILRKRPII